MHQQLNLHETEKKTFRNGVPLNHNYNLKPEINVLNSPRKAVTPTRWGVSSWVPALPAWGGRIVSHLWVQGALIKANDLRQMPC